MMIFDVANSTKSLEELGIKKYIEWLELALNCFFHCVTDYDGIIDKYTGDGAMVIFSLGNRNQRYTNAINCSLNKAILKKNLL
ncbi:MAG: hypothetical protein ACTSQQ_12755 [Candidatus Helarchaeota archaeon]